MIETIVIAAVVVYFCGMLGWACTYDPEAKACIRPLPYNWD